jgi:hypothetical protein
MFRDVEGVVGSEEFVRRATEEAKKQNQSFDAPRFYVNDDELIVSENRTYAFTKMWGKRTPEALDLLIEAFPDAKISCEISS